MKKLLIITSIVIGLQLSLFFTNSAFAQDKGNGKEDNPSTTPAPSSITPLPVSPTAVPATPTVALVSPTPQPTTPAASSTPAPTTGTTPTAMPVTPSVTPTHAPVTPTPGSEKKNNDNNDDKPAAAVVTTPPTPTPTPTRTVPQQVGAAVLKDLGQTTNSVIKPPLEFIKRSVSPKYYMQQDMSTKDTASLIIVGFLFIASGLVLVKNRFMTNLTNKWRNKFHSMEIPALSPRDREDFV